MKGGRAGLFAQLLALHPIEAWMNAFVRNKASISHSNQLNEQGLDLSCLRE